MRRKRLRGGHYSCKWVLGLNIRAGWLWASLNCCWSVGWGGCGAWGEGAAVKGPSEPCEEWLAGLGGEPEALTWLFFCLQEHRCHHLRPVSTTDPGLWPSSDPGEQEGNERGAGRQTDRLTFPEHPPWPDELDPHSEPEAQCTQLDFIHLSLGLGLGRNQESSLEPSIQHCLCLRPSCGQDPPRGLTWTQVSSENHQFHSETWDGRQAPMPFLVLAVFLCFHSPFPQDPFSSPVLSLLFFPSLFLDSEVLSA